MDADDELEKREVAARERLSRAWTAGFAAAIEERNAQQALVEIKRLRHERKLAPK